VPRDQLSARIADLAASLKAAEKKIAGFEAQALAGRAPQLASQARRIGSLSVVSAAIGAVGSADDLRTVALAVRDQLGADGAVVALGATVADRPIVIVATNEAARAAGAKAGALAKGAAGVLGGGGGGRDDVAQGGGADAAALPAALDGVVRSLEAATA
jgi:alanyl-tRNA synthetase